MCVKQISVFVQSKPGHLLRVLNAFAENNVSVRGFSASDTGDYGIVRFVVDKPSVALDVLSNLGFAATTTDVLCMKLADTPGALEHVIKVLAENNINVQYSYSLISTYICIRTSNETKAKEVLEKSGVSLLSQSDFC